MTRTIFKIEHEKIELVGSSSLPSTIVTMLKVKKSFPVAEGIDLEVIVKLDEDEVDEIIFRLRGPIRSSIAICECDRDTFAAEFLESEFVNYEDGNISRQKNGNLSIVCGTEEVMGKSVYAVFTIPVRMVSPIHQFLAETLKRG